MIIFFIDLCADYLLNLLFVHRETFSSDSPVKECKCTDSNTVHKHNSEVLSIFFCFILAPH